MSSKEPLIVPEAHVVDDPVDHVPPPPRRQRRQWACLLTAVVVATLALFIPRSPQLHVEKIAVAMNSTTSTVQVQTTSRFRNMNFYGMKWDHVHTAVYWLPDSVVVPSLCFPSDDDLTCDSTHGGRCAVCLGETADSDHFDTPPRTERHRTFTVTATDQEQRCAEQMALLALGAPQLLYSEGTATAQNGEKWSISPKYYTFS